MQQNEELTPERQRIIEMAVESWRFSRLFARMSARLDAGEQARFQGQLRWYVRRLEEHVEAFGLRLVNLEGQSFDTGTAANALNAADFGPDDRLCVEQMVEPIIMGPTGLVRPGTVLLRKVEQ